MTTNDDLRSKTLSQLIQQEIAERRQPLSFATFMERALYHPVYGYYNASSFDLGKRGDFTTAPELTPLFGKCIANQCEQLFSVLSEKNILELGAGTGRLACDLLMALKERDALPDHYYIYEISLSLRKRQQALLQKYLPELMDRIVWLDAIPSSLIGIVIANEVLDALPVHCFRIEDGKIKERCVNWDGEQFVWEITTPTNTLLEERVKTLLPLPDHYESEINLQTPILIETMANALTQGVMLLLDYGYGQREYYRPERNKGTLTCFYQHHHHDNPLIRPGLQDITAHVDFTQVIEVADANGCALLGYTTQAAFLLALGLMVDAAQAELELSATEQIHFHHAIKLLTLPMEMGERVKVMALGKNMDIALKGFELQDRSRDL
jgi:SAM-dependent MidA family methyltransferase